MRAVHSKTFALKISCASGMLVRALAMKSYRLSAPVECGLRFPVPPRPVWRFSVPLLNQ